MLPDSQHEHDLPHRPAFIIGLVIAHLAAAVMLGTCVRMSGSILPDMAVNLRAGLALAQGALLGLWCGLGSAGWRLRLTGLVIGTACLAITSAVVYDDHDWEIYFICGFNTCSVAALLGVLRLLRYRLAVPHGRTQARQLQFGIRHLLLLTVFVSFAVVFMVSSKIPDSPLMWVFFVALLQFPFIAVGVVSPWAILGKARLTIPGTVLLLVVTAAAWATYVDWDELQLTRILLAESVVLVVTLFVVRLCGYRLVRQGEDARGGLPRE